jgi:predicted dehydrogenase
MARKFLNRRHFLLGSLAVGAGGTGYWFSRRPVRLALIGAGTQGNTLAHANRLTYWLGGLYGRIVAVCDVDTTRATAACQQHCRRGVTYSDYRKVLERDDIEAVLVATPDHWHAAIAIHAMQADKAVYCEKPVSLTVAEGQQLVRTVSQTKAVFLGGTQQRSMAKFRTAVELVRAGRLGRVHTITVTVPERWKRDYEGPFFNFPVAPPWLDWDAWLGQAPKVDFCLERCHGSFRRWYEYSGGQMTDWGAHHMDIAHWALGITDGGPLAVHGRGKMPHVANGFNTPIEFTVDLLYPDAVRVHVRSHPDFDENGLRFEGDEGSLFVNRERIEGKVLNEIGRQPLSPGGVPLGGDGSRANILTHHLRHFYACIRHGEQPVADVVSLHRSATACHLGNLSMRLGRPLTWDAAHEQVVGDPGANAMLAREQRSPYLLPS